MKLRMLLNILKGSSRNPRKYINGIETTNTISITKAPHGGEDSSARSANVATECDKIKTSHSAHVPRI